MAVGLVVAVPAASPRNGVCCGAARLMAVGLVVAVPAASPRNVSEAGFVHA